MFTDLYFANGFYRGLDSQIAKNDPPVYVYEFKYHGGLNVAKKLISVGRKSVDNLIGNSIQLCSTFHVCSNYSGCKKIIGACHADELGYLFYYTMLAYKPEDKSEDRHMCSIMSKLWCNFSKFGYVNNLLTVLLKR